MRIVIASIVGVGVSIVVNLTILFLGTLLQLFTSPSFDGTPEGLEQLYQPLQFRDYIVPMLAHLLGLLSGLVAARSICKTSSIPIFVVAGLHLIGVAFNLYETPHPTWFAMIDVFAPVLLAYLFINKVKTH